MPNQENISLLSDRFLLLLNSLGPKMYSIKVIVLLVLITNSFGYQRCDLDNSVDISEGIRRSNGDVYFNGLKLANSEYYLDSESGKARGCLCVNKTCVRKCCPFGSGYNFLKKQCENVTDVFDPPVWDRYRLMRHVKASELFQFIFGKMNCTYPEYRIRISQMAPHYHLRTDGQLYVESPNAIPPWFTRPSDKFCIDTFVYEDEDGLKTTKIDALVCSKAANDDENSNTYVSSTCMLISCVFILATVAVYLWLPELRNLHGRVLVTYLLCLFVGFLVFATMQILLIADNINADACLVMTFIIYFFLLSAFFWMNVMSFDIWWTFSGKRGLSLEKLSIRARFCAYAAYAFGMPTALTALMAALEFSSLPAHPLMPNIRLQGCFLFGHSRLLYLYSPMVVLCVANTVFFVLTAVKIARIKQQTSVLKSKESSTHDQHRNDKQRLLLYVKLFIVMGINWILEVISALYPQHLHIFRYTDAYNVLIGLIIFIIFVCKRKIFRLIKKRYRQLRGEPISRTQTVSSRTMSSRDDNVRMSSVKTNS